MLTNIFIFDQSGASVLKLSLGIVTVGVLICSFNVQERESKPPKKLSNRE